MDSLMVAPGESTRINEETNEGGGSSNNSSAKLTPLVEEGGDQQPVSEEVAINIASNEVKKSILNTSMQSNPSKQTKNADWTNPAGAAIKKYPAFDTRCQSWYQSAIRNSNASDSGISYSASVDTL
eukprot:gene43992-54666_t